ncbi:MAG: site-specific integrase [Pseudomonadota bacterium]|nr:site-specific integrase [Pseudomonadota bacterium]
MASVSKREWSYRGETKTAWIVRWVDAGGKHCQRTFAKKKEADGYRTKIESEEAKFGKSGAVRDVTVRELLDEYGRYNDRRFADGQLKRGSLRNLSMSLDKSVRRHLGRVRVSELDPILIERWFMDLREKDGLSARTAYDRMLMFSTLWKFAKRQKMARGDNPVSEAIQHVGAIPKKRIRAMTSNDVQAVLAASGIRRKGQHAASVPVTQLAVHIAAFCGLRIGEILALRLCDLDLERRHIAVRHTLNGWDELTEPKTVASHRTVPAPRLVADMLSGFIRDRYVPNERQLIFRAVTSRTGQGAGGPINVTTFNTCYWKPLLQAAGLQDEDAFHFHALRHFAGSWWLRNGLPVADVSRLLGHANPSITMKIYIHEMLDAEERASAIDTYAAALLAPPVAQELRTGQNLLSYQSH